MCQNRAVVLKIQENDILAYFDAPEEKGVHLSAAYRRKLLYMRFEQIKRTFVWVVAHFGRIGFEP